MKTFLILLILLQFPVIAQTKRPLTIDDLWGMKRIGTANLSPDGKTLVFDVFSYNMDENTENSLIHGSPHDHWEDDFHYRWNTELFASRGYIVIVPNPTGSTGYGQEFTNAISTDWGGRPYKDLMAAYDYSIKNFSYIDPQNTFAAGASYGGYMINWIECHTDRFNTLVSHDGDYRVHEEQAFQLFTYLQRLGVESRLLLFTNEYHFVVKPQDGRFGWNSIFDWFKKHQK